LYARRDPDRDGGRSFRSDEAGSYRRADASPRSDGGSHEPGAQLYLRSDDQSKVLQAVGTWGPAILRLDVKVSGGIEIGSWAGADQFDPRSILDLARGSFD